MIEDALLREIKKKAAVEGRTLQDVANDLLRQALRGRSPVPFTLKLQGWEAKQQPGVDLLDPISCLT
jgi:hypothetical protein